MEVGKKTKHCSVSSSSALCRKAAQLCLWERGNVSTAQSFSYWVSLWSAGDVALRIYHTHLCPVVLISFREGLAKSS